MNRHKISEYKEVDILYSFTEKGQDLMPVFYAINWGFKYEQDHEKQEQE